jgi:phenylalanyl-tRNA synthetase alpha subunit
MSKTSDLNNEIERLSAKLAKSRDESEKAVLSDKINELKAEVKNIGVKVTEKKVVSQKEAPDRLDHVDKKIGRGSITNTGNTFLGIL